jgi:hypothetical protein
VLKDSPFQIPLPCINKTKKHLSLLSTSKICMNGIPRWLEGSTLKKEV